MTGGGKWVAKMNRAGGGRKGRGKVQRASDRVILWSKTESETGERGREGQSHDAEIDKTF